MANNDNTKNPIPVGGLTPELQSILALLGLAIRSGKPLSEQIHRELTQEELSQMIQYIDVVQESTH